MVSAPDTAPKSVFIISPIGKEGTEVHARAAKALKYIFKPALPEGEWHVHRADESKIPDSINQFVIRSIVDADLIIADLTGHNPNVFYELALAHALRKPAVHVISAGEPIPFDIVDQRTISYGITDLDSVAAAVEAVRSSADAAIANIDSLVTPLSTFAAFRSVQSIESNGNGEVVASVLFQILGRLQGLEAHLGAGRPAVGSAPRPTPLWGTLNELRDRGVFLEEDVLHLERELLHILQKRQPQVYGPDAEPSVRIAYDPTPG